MPEKVGPWIPAIFSAVLAVTYTTAELFSSRQHSGSNGLSTGFMIFMPMCFVFVGAYLAQLRNENIAMRSRLDALESYAEDS